MKSFILGTFIVVAVLAACGNSEAVTLSVNFVGGRFTTPNGGASVTGVAGAVPAGNWNNAFNQAGAIASPIDSFGNVGATNLTWTSSNIYAALGTAPGGGGNADMMNGYLDNFASGSITVTGLGSQFMTLGYDVLVYFNSDSAGTQGFSVTDNLLNTDTRFGNQAGGAGTNYPLAGPDGFIGSTQTANNTTFGANYVLLTGFSGSSFTLNGVNGAIGDGRARINGFQIFSIDPVPAPEPATCTLLALGLAGVAMQRRRQRGQSAIA